MRSSLFFFGASFLTFFCGTLYPIILPEVAFRFCLSLDTKKRPFPLLLLWIVKYDIFISFIGDLLRIKKEEKEDESRGNR